MMPHTVHQIPEMQLSAADDAAIAGLLARCFTTDFGGRSFFSHHHHLRLVIRNGGAIISHVALMLLIGLALSAAAALAFASLFGWSLDLSGARGQVIAANALLAMVVIAELLRAGLTLALLPRR